MKSNNDHTSSNHVHGTDNLRMIIQKEKEELVSMFLCNATLDQLSEQFRRIDELNVRIANQRDPEA